MEAKRQKANYVTYQLDSVLKHPRDTLDLDIKRMEKNFIQNEYTAWRKKKIWLGCLMKIEPSKLACEPTIVDE